MSGPAAEMAAVERGPARRRASDSQRQHLPVDDTGPGTGPVEWRPPKDGVLRGPPLSAPLPDHSLGLELLRKMQGHGTNAALVSSRAGIPTYRQTKIKSPFKINL